MKFHLKGNGFLEKVEFVMKYAKILLAGVMAAVAMTAAGQATTAPSEAVPATSGVAAAATDASPGLHERYPRYQLRSGDSFDLDMTFSPEFNQTLVVQPDGYVTLKVAGSLHVEGLTVPQLTEALKTAYAKILHDPVISIALKDFEKPYFIAAGQVTKPGKYDLRSDLTVTEAVAIAGGFNDKAKHSQVLLFRPVSGGYETKLLDIKKLMATRNMNEDVHLQPGDMVFVPQSAFSRIRPFLPTSSMGAFASPAAF
jgi:polysaccharide biosynthesis/export protein